jgi:GNAT superfamily N-acetyltransferase
MLTTFSSRSGSAGVNIASGHVPGALGRLVELHAGYYWKQFQFGLDFELRVSRTVGRFLDNFDHQRDGVWFAMCNGRIEGTISIEGLTGNPARLRWFIVSEEARRRGIGSLLLAAAVTHCRQRSYRSLYLWTFEQCTDAKRLYQRSGFLLTDKCETVHYGRSICEERYELQLGSLKMTDVSESWLSDLRCNKFIATAQTNRLTRWLREL